MKPGCYKHGALLALSFFLGASAMGAEEASPSGRWEGAIELPGARLGIAVTLNRATDAGWSGTIDIPVQGVRQMQLARVSVTGTRVTFAMPNVPGDPTFAGELAADAGAIAGSFTQGGQTFPFRLTRAATNDTATTATVPSVSASPNSAPTPAPTPAAQPAAARGIPGHGIVGSWFGSLDLGGMQLRLALNVSEQAGQRVATLDSIDQGVKGIPISSITDTENGVRLVVRNGAEFEGTYRADGAELAGTWTQRGRSLPLVFLRQEKPFALARPQEPQRPFPYREEEVTFANRGADILLAGTLTLPNGAGPFPAVVLLSGSGPQDRDESLMGHRPFLVLADHLTRAGIAVLRYDDRGFGRSGGNHMQSTPSDFASDARAALAFLRTRAEIDVRRIGLLGHSEGSVHAPLAAIEETDVAFMVFLAGVGVPITELLERQAQDVLRLQAIEYTPSAQEQEIERAIYERMRTLPDDPETPAFIRARLRESFELLPDEMKRALGFNESQVESRAATMTTRWFMALTTYDPRPVLAQVRCPVFALNGDKDVQVAADENLAGIKAALEAGGNRDVTVRKFEGLNHLFQHCTTGAVSEYGSIEETMAPEVLAAVAEWILARTRPAP